VRRGDFIRFVYARSRHEGKDGQGRLVMGARFLALALFLLVMGAFWLIRQAVITFPTGMVALLGGVLLIGACAWLLATK
jgi:hypothetical protein